MNKYLMVVFLLSACGPKREVVQIYKGDPGNDGKDGVSCTLVQNETSATITCGESSATLTNGENGQNGLAGLNGLSGSDGESCTVEQVETGALIICGEVSALITNGTDGEPGEDGDDSSSATITSYTSNSCTAIPGTDYSTKPSGSNSKLYLTADCSGSGEMTLTEGDSMWLNGSQLATKLVNTTGIRVVNFQ